MKRFSVAAFLLLLGVALATAHQENSSDEGGRILALEKAWNLALEEKDAKALDMLLAGTFVSVDIDGSIQSKGEFLASIKSPDINLPRRSRNSLMFTSTAMPRSLSEFSA